MVVLAASVVTKGGKILLSRQFVPTTRIRLEGLLAAFPKLIGSGKQHTYVETENVRYVYQPLEGLFVVLITTKASNILEDLETLRLLSKLIPDIAPPADEDSVCRCAFDLIFAFDEVIAAGHKENVTLQQVRTYMEMDSQEEKMHKMIIQSKIEETKQVGEKKIEEIKRAKQARGDAAFNSMLSSGMSKLQNALQEDPFSNKVSKPDSDDISTRFGEMGVSDNSRNSGAMGKPGVAPKSKMTLGKKKGGNAFMELMKSEGDVDLSEGKRGGATSGAAAGAAPSEPVTISMEEKITATIKNDGGVESFVIQGMMLLEINDENYGRVRVELDNKSSNSFKFQPHPNIDKGAFNSGSVLQLKDSNSSYPTGSSKGILRWRMFAKDEADLPISINCWPSVSGNETYVNIEYETSDERDLQNVAITIPVPGARDPPQVTEIDGDYKYDARAGVLTWEIDLIDNSNRNGSMEFILPSQMDTNSFFPVEVSFSSTKMFCDIAIGNVVSDDDSPAKYSSTSIAYTDRYEIV